MAKNSKKTEFDQDIAVRQQTPAGTPLRDGRISINQIDDWSGQGILGLTWQITDKAMLGVVYRSKSEVELDGDLDFYNIENPLVNNITSRLDRIEVDFDYAQLVAVGLAYDVTDRRFVTKTGAHSCAYARTSCTYCKVSCVLFRPCCFGL